MARVCGFDCARCPAAERCGRTPNQCARGRAAARCPDCSRDPLLRRGTREAIVRHLDGLDFHAEGRVVHPTLPPLPRYLPILVQAYAEPIPVPWVAIHGRRLLGVGGQSLTPKHRQPVRDVYRLSPGTRVALEFFVDDRALEGIWRRRRELPQELLAVGADLVLTPNMSVWRDAARFEQLVQQRRAFLLYHQLVEAGLPAVPDVGWSVWDPDGLRWAEWIDNEPGLEAVAIYCGGQKIHAERRAHLESVEDLALFHRALRTEVTFILGGVHAPGRLRDYRAVCPGRELIVCNAQAYSLAQRRRLLGPPSVVAARSARECFLRNLDWCTSTYEAILGGRA